MITRNELKYYSSLLIKKFRKEEKKFIIEGEKNVLEGLNSSAKCEIAFITHELAEVNPDIKESVAKKCRLEILKQPEFNKLSDTVNPQGICAVFKMPQTPLPKPEQLKDPLLVMFDEISDPGNAGTIIRTCDWFGVKNIFMTSGCAEAYNPKTLRSSMGSIFHTNIFENVDPENFFPLVKSAGYKICCTDLSGTSVYDYSFTGKTLLVFSSESKGPSHFILTSSDERIVIPGYGKAESLNVATAAGIIISEAVKQVS
jgi:RNA methyltransferase, TrmH family